MNADDPRHGTLNGYTNLNCRCERCKEAAHVYYQERGKFNEIRSRRKRGIRPREQYLAEIEPEHGTESRYTWRGCRCGPCTYAANVARAERRRRPNPKIHNANAYSNGCRCSVCREAHRLKNLERRQAIRG